MPDGSTPIPQQPEELTPEWLTRALREGGVLEKARVTRVDASAGGPGLASRLLRLHVSYDSPEPTAPQTLIAKLPSEIATNRATAELVGAYAREILFYREFAPEVGMRTPRHYYSAMDPGARPQGSERLDRLMGLLPSGLLAYLPGPTRWLARRSRRRYVLLLEDLAPARAGDQLAGCTTRDAARALEALATTHARFWESARLEQVDWLAASRSGPRVRQAVFRRVKRGLLAQRGEIEQEIGPLPEPILEAADWLDRHGLAVLEHLASPPRTLLHGDYRLDNLFFEATPDDPGIAAVDWATVHCGRAAGDVGFFLGCTLEGEDAQSDESRLLEGYHAALLARGVKGYGLDELRRDCELSKLVLVQSILLSSGALEVDTDQAAELGASFMRRVACMVPQRSLDDLLG